MNDVMTKKEFVDAMQADRMESAKSKERDLKGYVGTQCLDSKQGKKRKR